MTVLDSGFHTVDSGFQVLDLSSFSMKVAVQIQIVRRIPDFLSCTPDSKAPDCRFYNSNFPDYEFHSRNFPDSGIPVCGEACRLKGLCHLYCYLFITCLRVSGISKIMVQYNEGHGGIETVSCLLLLQMAGIDMD